MNNTFLWGKTYFLEELLSLCDELFDEVYLLLELLLLPLERGIDNRILHN